VHVGKDMRELVKILWKNVVSSPDKVEYQQQLNALEQTFVKSSKFVDYVNNTWLTPHKERFVAVWSNQMMHLGNTVTNRYDYVYFKIVVILYFFALN
jgi:hypothetical protein